MTIELNGLPTIDSAVFEEGFAAGVTVTSVCVATFAVWTGDNGVTLGDAAAGGQWKTMSTAKVIRTAHEFDFVPVKAKFVKFTFDLVPPPRPPSVVPYADPRRRTGATLTRRT